jgi:membrane associated rhomboid family serine protease
MRGMNPGPQADAPAAPTPDAVPAGPPTPADVLRWCAAAGPGLWFPSAHAQKTGVPRDSLDEPLWVLRQAGLVHVADWVRGRGQGYALTPAGEKALADPHKLTDIRPEPAPVVAEDIPPEDADLAHVPDPVAAPPPRPRNPGITAYDRGELTREAFLAPRPAVLTPVLLVANVGWFLVGLVTAWRMDVSADVYLQGKSAEVLHKIGSVRGLDLLAGEWWRLLTSGLVHVGGVHLVVNMLSLAMIGPVAEALWARWRFAGLYLLTGLAGACAAMALHPAAVVAGASGSIWGIVAAVAASLIRYREHLPTDFVSAWLRRLAVVVGVNALVSLLPGISWQAHLGGAAAGFFGAIFLDLTRPGANRRQFIIGLAGLAALVAVMAGGLVAAIYLTDDWKALRMVAQLRDQGQRAAANQRVPLPDPFQVRALHEAAAVALIARGEGATAAAREEAAHLKAEAARAEEVLPPSAEGLRPYLVEVRRYAELVDGLLAANRLPTPDECTALSTQLARVGQTWPTATGQGIDQTFFSFPRPELGWNSVAGHVRLIRLLTNVRGDAAGGWVGFRVW